MGSRIGSSFSYTNPHRPCQRYAPTEICVHRYGYSLLTRELGGGRLYCALDENMDVKQEGRCWAASALGQALLRAGKDLWQAVREKPPTLEKHADVEGTGMLVGLRSCNPNLVESLCCGGFCCDRPFDPMYDRSVSVVFCDTFRNAIAH